jgi:hypothetical protein
MLLPIGPAVVQFPATSQTVCEPVEAVGVSDPAATLVVSEKLPSPLAARPDAASAAVQGIDTLVACQLVSALPHCSVGAAVSRMIVTAWVEVPPPLVAVQMYVMPLESVSVLLVVLSQPEDELIAESGSLTVQLTVTSPVYQPLSPTFPVMLGVMTGGVWSVEDTVTLNEPVAVFPWLSVALQLTVVVPIGRWRPTTAST